jgi:hypothetical protein
LHGLQAGRAIYLPFHTPYVGAPVKCADGSQLEVPEDEDEAEMLFGDMRLEETATNGFLVTLAGGSVMVQTATYCDRCDPVLWAMRLLRS